MFGYGYMDIFTAYFDGHTGAEFRSSMGINNHLINIDKVRVMAFNQVHPCDKNQQSIQWLR